MTDEFRVKVTVRNNLILSAVEALGYKGWGSIGRFCADAGIAPNDFTNLVSFRTPPINMDGEFRLSAKLLMEALGAAPSDLWTDRQLTLSLTKNSAEATTNAVQIESLLSSRHDEAMTLPSPEIAYGEGMTRRLVSEVLQRLSPRQHKVLAMRFGLEGCSEHSLQEIAESMDVTRERIRQVEAAAIRKVREIYSDSQLADSING